MNSQTSASWTEPRATTESIAITVPIAPALRTVRRWLGASALGLVCSWTAPAHAETRQDGVDPDDQETRAEAPQRPNDMPLATLPTPPDARPKAPRPRALEALDRLLSGVVDKSPDVRNKSAAALVDAKSDWVSAIERRIDRIAERADRGAMAEALERAREEVRARMPTGSPTPDYLQVVLDDPHPDSQPWRDLAQVLALSRMLVGIGSTDATREIIRIYVRFGDFMRIDTQRQLEALGDLSIAALIETLRHPAPAIADWAEARLRLRGRLSPHDAVRIDNPKALADVLVALGRNRDPESTRLLISFSGTEDPDVRRGARQAIALLGEVGAWQLRDAYLDTTGRRPPRDWTWKRTARELFTEFDRLRLEEIYALYAEAKKARESGNLEKMRQGYDRILTLNPNFDGRKDMVQGYRDYAKSVAESKPDEALLALRRAARIDSDEASQRETKAARLLLEARLLRREGIIDTALLERAKEFDPSVNAEVLELRTPGSGTPVWGAQSRYLAAFAVALLALGGATWILLTSLGRGPARQKLRRKEEED